MSETDPESYSIALDLAIIAAIFGTVAVLLGGASYTFWRFADTRFQLDAWFAPPSLPGDTGAAGPSSQGPAQSEAERKPKETPASPHPQEPPTTPKARFEVVDSRRSPAGNFWLHGRLSNESDHAIGPPRIKFVLEDVKNRPINSQWFQPDWIGLRAGENRVLSVQLEGNPNADTFSVTAIEVVEKDLPPRAEKLKALLSKQPRRRRRRILRGIVLNQGNSAAYHVEVDVVGYKELTKTLTGVSSVKLPASIPPGGSARFKVGPVEFSGPADEIIVVARGYTRPIAPPTVKTDKPLGSP